MREINQRIGHANVAGRLLFPLGAHEHDLFTSGPMNVSGYHYQWYPYIGPNIQYSASGEVSDV